MPYTGTVTLCDSIRKLYFIKAVNVLIWTPISITARMILCERNFLRNYFSSKSVLGSTV
jgi:hypothetical protein